MSLSYAALDPSQIRDISPLVLGDDGRMRVLPAEFWIGTTQAERILFGHLNGIYSFPTVELVEHLKALIGDRSAIEIGAGHGVLAQAPPSAVPGVPPRQRRGHPATGAGLAARTASLVGPSGAATH